MAELSPDDFPAFFGELHRSSDGRPLEPFPWQTRVAERVARHGWGDPRDEDAANETEGRTDWLALPTAAGKTACLDIAVFALACHADREPTERTVPRRIFFVVDRRLIVDAAFRRASELADALDKEEPAGETIALVAERLRRLTATDGTQGGGNRPLRCFQLRGGIYRNDQWPTDPVQPTIVCSTVDQVGSRLLYRSYGRSGAMTPIDAGLAGNDALVFVDEAHCANPFGRTVDAVMRYRNSPWAEHPLAAPFALVQMTATPPKTISPITLTEKDRRDPVLGARIQAPKSAKLQKPVSANRESNRFINAFDECAERMVENGARRIGIVVNRVDTAKRIHERLSAEARQTTLLVGRMREVDRAEVVNEAVERFAANPERATDADEPPRYLVATQTVEVGADLDFDALVTESASLDALHQRFGRLNRLGRYRTAQAAVVVAQADTKTRTPDPVYGDAIARTWAWLVEHATGDGWPKHLDMGIETVKARLDSADPARHEELRTPSPEPPILLPAHLDRWAQTSPPPAPDPDPGLFLRGTSTSSPEVEVCWRADMLPDDAGSHWLELLSLCPPASSECMTAPLAAVRAWLRAEDQPAEGNADVPASQPFRDEDGSALPHERRGVIWRGRDQSRVLETSSELMPGDTLVLPLVTLRDQTLGHVPLTQATDLSSPAMDVGDMANWSQRRQAVLRLRREAIRHWPDTEATRRVRELVRQADEDLPEDEDELLALLEQIANESAGQDGDEPPWSQRLTEIVEALGKAGRVELMRHPLGGIILRGRSPVRDTGGRGEAFTSEDETASASSVPVLLEEHAQAVGRRASQYAESCGMSRGIATDLRIAGWFHDVGKADERYQEYLHGGNKWLAAARHAPLAKSEHVPESRREHQRAWDMSELPEGYRHELASMQLLQLDGDHLSQAHDRDLVLHLVATHHGRARPLAPVVQDDDPPELVGGPAGETWRLTPGQRTTLPPHRLDSGVPERFWRLLRRYGWWGLAYLEALFRLADHRISEEEQKQPSDLRKMTTTP